jgi:hypothetical protein
LAVVVVVDPVPVLLVVPVVAVVNQPPEGRYPVVRERPVKEITVALVSMCPTVDGAAAAVQVQ